MIPTGETIADVILAACRQHSDRIAFSCMGRYLNYAQLEKQSATFAAYLQNCTDLKSGDRIAIQLPNILQYPIVALGALRAGLVIVNTNPLYSTAELEHQLNDAGARAIVVLANTAANAARIIKNTPIEKVIVTQIGDLHNFPKRQLINFLVKYVKKMVPDYRFAQQISFRKALALGRKSLSAKGLKTESLSGKDTLAVLQYTGGTTGRAKGAMLSHSNLVANMYQFEERLEGEGPEAGDVMVAPLPLYHIYAFTIHMMYAVHKGMHNVLITNPRDIPAFVNAIKPYRISVFVGLNTLYNALCANKEFAKLDFSGLKISSSGGMALSSKTFRRWLDLTGCKILEGYGLTETSPLVSCNCSANFQEGTIGKPVLETQVKVIDEAGNEMAVGEAGELCVKGPQVMVGYWQQSEETRNVLDADGWLRTGDLAIIQPDGFIRIVDRIKDLIIVAGFNVYPAEVEDFICQHPDIKEAAVIGIKRGDGSEKVKLFAVSSNPELSRKDIIEYCEGGLAPYKIPRLVEFRDSLPKSNLGKILRRELRN